MYIYLNTKYEISIQAGIFREYYILHYYIFLLWYFVLYSAVPEEFFIMNRPELYIHNNTLQENDAINIFSEYVEKMTWKPNEMILDIGCGTGNVTMIILNNILKYNIKKLVCIITLLRCYFIKYYICPRSIIYFQLIQIHLRVFI